MNLPQLMNSNPLQLKNASEIMDALERARRVNHSSDSTLVDWDAVEQMVISTYEQYGDASSLDRALLHQMIEERRNVTPQMPNTQAFFAQTYYPLEQTSLTVGRNENHANRVYRASSQYSKKERLAEMEKALTHHIPYTDAELLAFHQKCNQNTQNSKTTREFKTTLFKKTHFYLGCMLLITLITAIWGPTLLLIASALVSMALGLMVYSEMQEKTPEPVAAENNPEDFQKLLLDLFVRHTRINNVPSFVVTPPSLEQINRYYNGHYQPNLFVDESNPNIVHFLNKTSSATVREIYTKWKIRQLPLRHLELQALICLNDGKSI